RKIIVDTYGGYGRHGGGAFSGKDPSKVDRSAAYMARYIAKNIVAAELSRRCEVQVAYAIGVAEPVSVLVDTFGTGAVPDDRIAKGVREIFDLRPAAIIETLGLKKPIYRPTASYGHFGRTPQGDCFTWDPTGRVADRRPGARAYPDRRRRLRSVPEARKGLRRYARAACRGRRSRRDRLGTRDGSSWGLD